MAQRIKSDHSWMKHDMLWKVISPQVAAQRMIMPTASMWFVDANAGDGEGVDLQQFDLFGSNASKPTPIMLRELALKYNAKLIVCERNRQRNYQLRHRFINDPNVTVLSDNIEAGRWLFEHKDDVDFLLWVADVCGYKDKDLRTDVMSKVAHAITRSDFVVVFNEGAVKHRLNKVDINDPYFQTHRDKQYPELVNWEYWYDLFGKRYLARAPLRYQSANFHFRLMVAANFLTDGVRRIRNIEIMEREK